MTIIMRRTPFQGGAIPIPPPPVEITISVSPTSGTVAQNDQIVAIVTITRTNFSGDVSLTATGLPSGASASFLPDILTGATLTSTMTILPGLSAPGTNQFNIVASGSGVSDVTTPYDLTVTAIGTFEDLRPSPTLPMSYDGLNRMTFNSTTADIDSTTVDTREPDWAVTDSSLIDTGNAVTNMANLNSLLSTYRTAATGNTLILCNMNISGTITFLNNTHGFWIGIQGAPDVSLPALGPGISRGKNINRIASSDIANLPLHSNNGANPFTNCANGANHYWYRGFAQDNTTNSAIDNLNFITPPNTTDTVVANYPSDIIFQQISIDGGSGFNTKRGWFIKCFRFAAEGFYLRNVGTSADSHVGGVFAGHQIKISNYDAIVGGADENVLVGGVQMIGTGTDLLPMNVEVSGFLYASATSGTKNHGEVKMGLYILFTAGSTSNHGGGGQGSTFYATLTSSSNLDTQSAHIIFHNLRTTGGHAGAIACAGNQADYSGPNNVHDVWFGNILAYGSTPPYPWSGQPIRINSTGDIENLTIKHCSLLTDQSGVYNSNVLRDVGMGIVTNGQVLRNVFLGFRNENLTSAYWFEKTSKGNVAPGMNDTWLSSSGINNTTSGTVATMPGNQIPSGLANNTDNTSRFFFTNAAGNDYSLTSSSPGYQLGGDIDNGVAFVPLLAILADVI